MIKNSLNDSYGAEEAKFRTDGSPVSESRSEFKAEAERAIDLSAKKFQEAKFRTDGSPVSESRSEFKAEAGRAIDLSAKKFQEAKFRTDGGDTESDIL